MQKSKTASSKTEKEPLIRLTKKDLMPGWKMLLIRFGALIVALLLGSLIFMIVGANPLSAYVTMIAGSLGKKSGIRQVVKIAVLSAVQPFHEILKLGFLLL